MASVAEHARRALSVLASRERPKSTRDTSQELVDGPFREIARQHPFLSLFYYFPQNPHGDCDSLTCLSNANMEALNRDPEWTSMVEYIGVLSTLVNPHFRLCFAEAPVPSQLGPVVVSVYRHFGDFKGWIPMPLNASVSSTIFAEKILNSLRHIIEHYDRSGADGEWVAVLGFSQAARLAASLLFQEQLRGTGLVRGYGEIIFRFAVLFARRDPIISVDADAMMSVSSADLSVPTIHIHGLQDPGLEYHRGLLER
ncbi:hypothetical protein BO79DRAFT_253334 [Aspergillus costaricaensis CBS 115574]|uniref:Uncharacterized protein n=1 Tax=Aspergillus costaricaensis CBS 115574 TaxID=1448317 RepID=A0ACD1ILD7_9EURO|nr:hypothetical protein BO79DRAFT_253334 [Aspergillus costaricaensis CBS 115574]RAK90551.1 hypothetical protein BO79DRAFT_253334 [Aspergillus costaricaensis CBS 115574]